MAYDKRQPAVRKPPVELVELETKALSVVREIPAGAIADVVELTRRCQTLSARTHLLSPTVSPDMIPEFHSVAIRFVVVSADQGRGEVYKPVGCRDGEVALAKPALDKIAAAAGITWDPVRSGRLDNGKDRYYCHFRRVGYLTDLSGARRVIVGEKEIDARDGNPTIFTDDKDRMAHEWDDQRRCYTDKIKNPGFVRGWSFERLTGVREHILAMAESKAGNRAIRSLGLRQKYHVGELERPFAVLSLVLTGDHPDPDIQRMAKAKLLDASIAASRELYPSSAATAVSPPPAVPLVGGSSAGPILEQHDPPPVHVGPEADDEAPWDEIERGAKQEEGEWQHD
jgi:hypothetical protein